MWLTLALLQAAATGPALTRTERDCTPRDDGEVVVCARPGESPHRLKPLPPRPGDPPRAPLGFRLPGGGEGRLHAVQSNLLGASGQGLAITAKIPLGRKRKPAR